MFYYEKGLLLSVSEIFFLLLYVFRIRKYVPGDIIVNDKDILYKYKNII